LPSDTIAVSRIFGLYVASIYISIFGIIGIRIIGAIQKGHIYPILGIVSLCFKILLNVILIQFWGVNGLPVATVISQIFNSFMIYTYIYFCGIKIFQHFFMIYLSRALACSLVVGAILFLSFPYIQFLNNAFSIMICGSIILSLLVTLSFLYQKRNLYEFLQ
jgi:O-antigen/teichoic acid export membrane protein